MLSTRILGIFCLLLACSFSVHAQNDTLQQRIVLVGDAGELHNGTHPVVDWLKKNVDWNDTTNRVIYLGDNIYQMGLPMEGAPGYEHYKQVIDYQISLVKDKKAMAYIIPGNHDWMNGGPGGLQQINNQVNYINGLGLPNVQAWPLNGCPGPIVVEIDDKVVLVIGDSQWFLHLHNKPGPGSACAAKTIEEFTTELNEIIQSHLDQVLIFAVHHPFYTSGPHGGGYSWKDHIFPLRALSKNLYIPLPVIGSAYPVSRGYFGNVQDIFHPLYRNMINEIEQTLKKHPNPIHVSGHEHALQLNVKDSIPYIVSGSGAKLNIIPKGRYAEFLHLNYGFTTIEVYKSGKVYTKFYDVDSRDLSAPVYVKQLKTIAPVTRTSTLDTLRHVLPDSITVVPNAKLKASGLREMLIGKNYREEWTEPVRVPVLDITKEAGGLRPVRQSGSTHLRILTLEDKRGKQWHLRSIEHFPQNVIPFDLRVPLDKDSRDDAMSAAYPFASIVVSELQKSAHIPAPRRKLIYVPDDPRLMRFTNEFGNSLAVLEEREPINIMQTIGTEELMQRMQRDNHNKVDQKKVLRARLMDNFVMDFNRNEAQYTWATYDTGKSKIYYPIPQNPSQAFFVNQGILPWLSHKLLAIPQIQGFDSQNPNIRIFNKTAYNFDHLFLNSLTRQDWENEIDDFLEAVTDDVIVAAVRSQPHNVAQYSEYHLTSSLQQRRKVFKEEMMRYYDFLSRGVSVAGSRQQELFTVTKYPDGSVHVLVQELDGRKWPIGKMYERAFNPRTTKEINIYGLEDNDSFVVKGNETPIQIRLIGGSGEDHFVGNGSGGEVEAHDVNFENNTITGSGIISKITADPLTNIYNRQQNLHNYILPGISLAYNIDDGAIIGGELEFFNHRFRKEPFSSRHEIGIKYMTNTRSYRFHYDADFSDIFADRDIIIRTDLRAPRYVSNFFGLGNNTVYDKNKPGGIEYYRTQYDFGTAAVMMRKNLQSWLNADIGPVFQYYQVKSHQNSGKYVTDTFAAPAVSPLYDTKFFLGAQAEVIINSKNNQVLPTRGAKFQMYIRQLAGLNADHNMPTQMGLDLSFFMSISELPFLVVGTRFGGGHNLGNFDFPQAQYLSGIENLRGYRKDRFAGRTMFFNNTEVRVRLQQFKTYLFPGSWGFLVFSDIGRVWTAGETSKRWHHGYGGGLWVSPVHRFVITTSAARSREEQILPVVSFGFQF